MSAINTPIGTGTNVAELVDGKAYSRILLPADAATDSKLELIRLLLANTLGVSVEALPLPAGAATDAALEAIHALLAGTIAISAAALPLPTGAATDATLDAVRVLLAGAATAAKQDSVKAALDAQAPADDIFAIVPNDTTNLTTIPRVLFVLTDGNLAVRGASGTTVTIPVKAGMMIPLKARRIMTASTATVAGLA